MDRQIWERIDNLLERSLAKVLDFGIAKFHEQHASDPAVAETGPGNVTSSTSVMMGTVSYMSPEQARSELVDARTDIFSLGVVLYEMVAGRKPFEGAINAEVIEAILEKQPAPLAQFTPQVPDQLQRIIDLALQKESEKRYQTAAAMLGDLKELGQRMELKAMVERESGDADSSGARREANLLLRNRRLAIGLLTALAALVLVTLGIVVWRVRPSPDRHPFPANTAKAIRLTHSGNVTDAAISRDGKYVAQVVDEAGRQSLWLREVEASNIRMIIPPVERDEFHGPTFSPDGQNIFYLRYEEDRDIKALYQVPTFGGEPKKVMDHVDHAVAFSPDGNRFAFVRHDLDEKESHLIVANADGSGERKLVARKEPVKLSFGWQWPTTSWCGRVAWSPDGKAIAYAAGTSGTDNDHQIYEVPANGGPERLLSSHRWWRIYGIEWVGSGKELFVLAANHPPQPTDAWGYPGRPTT